MGHPIVVHGPLLPLYCLLLSILIHTSTAGTTSKALIKEQPWLQKHLSSIACGISILFGLLMLLAGQGVNVPIFS